MKLCTRAHLDLLAAVQHLLDVVHHYLLHLAHLLLHPGHLADLIRVRGAVVHVLFQFRPERSIERVRDRVLRAIGERALELLLDAFEARERHL